MQAHTADYYQHMAAEQQDTCNIGGIIYDWLRLYAHNIDVFGPYFDMLYCVQAINKNMTLKEFMAIDHMKCLTYLEHANGLSTDQRREAVTMYVSFLYYISRITNHRFNPFKTR